jgi:hypothetical protein
VNETRDPEANSPEANWSTWLQEVQSIGGTNPLVHFAENSFGQINLERAHPGGLAQFVTGRPTLLSNLVRDPLSFSRALAAAKRIKSKQVQLSENFGLETLYLASGLIDFRGDGHDLEMPILLWPVNILVRGDDFELSLARKPMVNPGLSKGLFSSYGVKLNDDDLLSLVAVGSDPIPISVLNKLAELTDEVGNPELRRLLVVSNFSAAATDLEDDFKIFNNPVLDLFSGSKEPSEVDKDSGFEDPILVADADATQQRIVARAIAGQSFVVETLPGCGYTQSVVLTLAALAHQGKRVLVVAPRRQTLNELADRVAAIGLPGLGIRSNATWLDMISAISRNEKAQPDSVESLTDLRNQAREKVSNYFSLLEKVDGELGASISQALEELARLSGLANPPVTEARIPGEQLGRHRDRTFALTLLRQAEELGEFEVGPADSAWFRASFENPAEVEARISLARNIYQSSFKLLSEQLEEFTKAVDFQPAKTVADWSLYLKLFIGIRETLDKFLPEVYDRPLTELILATAPRREKSLMSGANRRRLRKLAKEYLRPGMHVSDMHVALKSIQEQRDLWQRHCRVAKPPQVPMGIQNVQVALSAFTTDLEILQQNLDSINNKPDLIEQPLEELRRILKSLSEDTKTLENYGERSMTQQRMEEAGLGSLARDLSRLHSNKEQLDKELEQAWWQSALETLLSRTDMQNATDWEQVLDNENNFALTETALIAQGAKAVSFSLSTRWKDALERFPDEAQTLKELLKLRRAVLPEVSQLAPNVYAALAPIVMLSPYEVPTAIRAGDNFDVILVLDGAGSSVAENLSGLARANQAIIYGDDAIAAAKGFSLECLPEVSGEELISESIFTTARKLFPIEVLRKSYRSSGQALGTYINKEFYQNRIIFEATVDQYFGLSNSKLELVSPGRSMSKEEASLESIDQEVHQTVELILNHALWHPQDSLLVATASTKHSEAIRNQLALGMQSKAHLAEFFEGHGREKFEVTTIADLSHRIADRIIFSIGFAKSSTGDFPKSYGQLSEQSGKRYLANLLVSARKQITLVSCFEQDDFQNEKSQLAPSHLKELLEAISSNSLVVVKDEINPMVSDLAERLTRLGAAVRTNFSDRFQLVASVGDKASVVEPDFGLLGYNLTERHRLRPMILRSMGWKYVRVPSFELFSNPEEVAQRIASQLGIEVSKKPLPLFELDERAFEDTDMAWGDREDSNDQRLRDDKPPHWG